MAEAEERTCAWCNTDDKSIELVAGKRYCFACDKNKYRECINCHLPYPDKKYFNTEDSEKCQNCEKKLEKQKKKRKRHQLSESDKEDESNIQITDDNQEEKNECASSVLSDNDETSNPLLDTVNQTKSKHSKKLTKESIKETKNKELDEIMDTKKTPKKRNTKNVKKSKKEDVNLPEVSPSPSVNDAIAPSDKTIAENNSTGRSGPQNFITELVASNNPCSYVEYFKIKYA